MPDFHIINPEVEKLHSSKEPPQTIVREMAIGPSVTTMSASAQATEFKLVKRKLVIDVNVPSIGSGKNPAV